MATADMEWNLKNRPDLTPAMGVSQPPGVMDMLDEMGSTISVIHEKLAILTKHLEPVLIADLKDSGDVPSDTNDPRYSTVHRAINDHVNSLRYMGRRIDELTGRVVI